MSILNKCPVHYTILDVLKELGFKIHHNGLTLTAYYEAGPVAIRIYGVGETKFEFRIYHHSFLWRSMHGEEPLSRAYLNTIRAYCVALDKEFHFSRELDDLDWDSVML